MITTMLEENIFSYMHAEKLLQRLAEALARRDEQAAAAALRPITDLYDQSDIITQYKLLTDLIELKYDAIRPLIRREVKHNPSALVRHEAAFGLGVFRNPGDTDVLIAAMLQDSHLMVRHEAAIALAATGDATCLDALEQATRESESSVVESAEYAIRQIGLKTCNINAART
jgi:HEAT repeat protein